MLERVKLKCPLCVRDFDGLFHGGNTRSTTRVIRKISRVRIGIQYDARHVSKVFTASPNQGVFDGRVELDTHTDTFVAGRNCLLMNYTERVYDVIPYSGNYEPKTGIPIVQAATGYTAANGQRSILIFNEALWLPDMENSLMNPNQLRNFGIDVQDNPYHRDPMIICKDDDEEGFVACLKSSGTNIYIDTWTPTDKDLEDYRKVTLTSANVWDPYAVRFPGLSKAEIGEIRARNVSATEFESKRELYAPEVAYDDYYCRPIRVFDIQAFNGREISSSVILTKVAGGPLSEDEILPPKTFLSSRRHSNTTPEDLSEVWNISVEQAKMTLEATTQHHVRSAIMPLSRRYRMDRMYEPKRLIGDMECMGIVTVKFLVTRRCFVKPILSRRRT